MKAEELRSKQAPLKQQSREHPEAALITLRAEGRVGDGITCKLRAYRESRAHLPRGPLRLVTESRVQSPPPAT